MKASVYLQALLLALFATACGKGNPQGSEAKTVFDKADLKLLTTADRNNSNVIGAVGNLLVVLQDPSDLAQKFAMPFCTAFQISPRHIMTAAHCEKANLVFNKNQISADADMDKLKFLAFDDVLRLSFDGEKIAAAAKATEQTLMDKVVFKDEALDVVVYESTSGTDEHFLDLNHIGSMPVEGNAALKLFGFPNGVPLSVASDCAGKLLAGEGGERFFHDCDAMKGSSGGLVVDANGLPLAMHLAGPVENSGIYYKANNHFESNEEIALYAGCDELADETEKARCIAEYGHNKAVPLSVVAETIKKGNPELWRAITGGACEAD